MKRKLNKTKPFKKPTKKVNFKSKGSTDIYWGDTYIGETEISDDGSLYISLRLRAKGPTVLQGMKATKAFFAVLFEESLELSDKKEEINDQN